MGIRSDIFEALATRLATVTGVKTVIWDRIRISESDFATHECPAIQFYAGSTTYTHQQGQIEASTQIAIEVILRGGDGTTQKTLFDLMEDIEKKIGEDPSLGGKSGIIHVMYFGDEVDLHTIEPFYIGRLNMGVLYRKPYSMLC